MWCIRYDKTPGYQKCQAFPVKIPNEIWSGEADHREHFEGDSGLTFEVDPAREETLDWPTLLNPEN